MEVSLYILLVILIIASFPPTRGNVMKFTVQQFVQFSTPFEGVVQTLYLDNKGLVTFGMGNLAEPIQLGWGAPWRHISDKSMATQSEYIAEWNTISGLDGTNGKPDAAKEGWRTAARYCKLYLELEDIYKFVQAKLDANEAELRKRVPNYDNLCADAQLMLHSWAWAVGPDANYPRMLKLINAYGYNAAISECDINPKVGTIILRNAANRQLLINAAGVRDQGLDPNVLVYPGVVKSGIIGNGPEVAPGSDYDHSVVSLQHALSLLGFSLAQDGIMGPVTTAAVQKFQGIHKLVQDGIAGPQTWAAIQQALRFR